MANLISKKNLPTIIRAAIIGSLVINYFTGFPFKGSFFAGTPFEKLPTQNNK
jgi:hypothetical protein